MLSIVVTTTTAAAVTVTAEVIYSYFDVASSTILFHYCFCSIVIFDAIADHCPYFAFITMTYH